MRARLIVAASAAVVVAAAWGASAARAEPSPGAGIKRTVLQKHDLRAPGEEGVMGLVEIGPGAREGRHTHPAEVFVYVIDGAVTLEMEGQPPADHKAGDTFFIPAGTVHEGINKGTKPAKAVAVFVADKGKPLTTQVAMQPAK